MNALLLPVLLAAAAPVPAAPPADTLSTITLPQAIERAAGVDPATVAARGRAGAASRQQRAARSAFFLPEVSAGADVTGFSDPAFNPGTLTPGTRIVTAQVQASYEVFGGGRRLAELRRARASRESAEAEVLRTRFATAEAVARDFYGVVAARELLRTAEDRVRRAREQLGVTRSRVAAGAAVHTDSLQSYLELTRARSDSLEREAALRVSRLQLGRRVGVAGPVDAVVDTAAPAPLPLPLDQAVAEALAGGPEFAAARAAERAADASLQGSKTAYLPRVMLTAAAGAFDRSLLPDQAYRSQIGVSVHVPLWDNGAREVAVAEARAARDAARATRGDLERGAAAAVTGAYEEYTTARASLDLATTGVVVARETFRVQQVRYRSGATTIIDVLEAQLALTRAEADRVHARVRAHLALAELETILGRPIFANENSDD